MTIQEVQVCAAETLKYFIEIMPEAPFGENDIVIEFAPKNKFVKRLKELAAVYAPDKTINESQERDILNNVASNAIVGRGKSAVVAWTDRKNTKQDWRRILFHEFAHIYCGKLENSEGFIYVFGNGYTAEKDMTPEEKIYDGYINAGYTVWTEFIAHYYSFKYTEPPYYVHEAQETFSMLLDEVRLECQSQAKGSFSYACALFLNAKDGAEEYLSLREEHKDSQIGKAFYDCLGLLYDKLQEDKPWLLTEEFIAELGKRYLTYFTINSMTP